MLSERTERSLVVLVVLEGLEGVGKTALGKAVALELGATYLKTPPPDMNCCRGFIASTASPFANFYFYLAGLYAMQGKIVELLKQNEIVIVDRYISSTIAYHAEGESFDPPVYDDKSLAKPDSVILIRCDSKVRRSRIEDRGLHIFERPPSNEAAISDYFSKVADIEFVNDKPLSESATALSALLRTRLGE